MIDYVELQIIDFKNGLNIKKIEVEITSKIISAISQDNNLFNYWLISVIFPGYLITFKEISEEDMTYSHTLKGRVS